MYGWEYVYVNVSTCFTCMGVYICMAVCVYTYCILTCMCICVHMYGCKFIYIFVYIFLSTSPCEICFDCYSIWLTPALSRRANVN